MASEKTCSAAPADYYWPGGNSETPDAKRLLAGERSVALGDYTGWEQHPFTIQDVSGCTCEGGDVPIALIKREETFYDTTPGVVLTSANGVCHVLMSGFLNYYQPCNTCQAEGKGQEWKVGFPDTAGKCVKKGTKVAADGQVVFREGKWYTPPQCVSVRIVGQEEQEPLVSPGSCQCCGDYEYMSPSGGVSIYAGGNMNRAAKMARQKAQAKAEMKKNKKIVSEACKAIEVHRENEIVRSQAQTKIPDECKNLEKPNGGAVITPKDRDNYVNKEKNSADLKTVVCAQILELANN